MRFGLFLLQDLYSADLSGFRRSHVNVTTFQIIDQHSHVLLDNYKELKEYGKQEFLFPAVWNKDSPSVMVLLYSILLDSVERRLL